MVMVVSTAGLTGRGRVEPFNIGSNGDGMYGWLNAPEVPTNREEALQKAAKRIKNHQQYLKRKEKGKQ